MRTWWSKAWVIVAFAGVVLCNSLSSSAAQPLEKTEVRFGTGGLSALYNLPIVVAEQLGYFKEQGLVVEVNDFAGGAKALQALLGGSADFATGGYEYTIRMQLKGQDIAAVLELTRLNGITLAVRTQQLDKYKSPASLKGMKIGVTAPGSNTQWVAWNLMVKAGLSKDDASFIGVGSGSSAISAMQRGEIDAIVNVEPTITMLEKMNLAKVVVDTRSEKGNTEVFGGPTPNGIVYTTRAFIEKNPRTTQALVNALYKALVWIGKSTPDQIADVVPKNLMVGDRATYIAAVTAIKDTFSQTGIGPMDGRQRSIDFLKPFDPELATAKIDLAKTFDERFAKAAAAAIK